MADLKPLKIAKDKPQGFKKIFLKSKKIMAAVILLIALAVGAVWLMSSNSTVFNYVMGKGTSLKLENNRVNVLLLGIAGGSHDGPNLTDTIMVASYNRQTQRALLISLPRDFWVEKQRAKVNSLYALGLEKGDGLGFARAEIGQILGLEIPYAVRVDFQGFIKAVDLLEGIDVLVAKPFDDFVYPIEGKEKELCGYQEKEVDMSEEEAKKLTLAPGKHQVLLDTEGKIATASARQGEEIKYTDEQVLNFFSCRFERLSFKGGLTHMDGATALKFVRSRHGNNGEGSDFARSKRQQLVLQAFKDKVLSLETLTDLQKMVELAKTFGASVESDILQSQYLDFVKLIRQIKASKNIVIDSSGETPLLVVPQSGDFGGAWVLIPPDNDLTRIHQFVAGVLAADDASASAREQR